MFVAHAGTVSQRRFSGKPIAKLTIPWLNTHDSSTVGYQDKLEEWLALEAYVAELHAQAVSLADVAQELMLEQEAWRNPDLLLASSFCSTRWTLKSPRAGLLLENPLSIRC